MCACLAGKLWEWAQVQPDCPGSHASAVRLYQALGNLIYLWCPCSLHGSWSRRPSELPSNSNDFIILILSLNITILSDFIILSF